MVCKNFLQKSAITHKKCGGKQNHHGVTISVTCSKEAKFSFLCLLTLCHVADLCLRRRAVTRVELYASLWDARSASEFSLSPSAGSCNVVNVVLNKCRKFVKIKIYQELMKILMNKNEDFRSLNLWLKKMYGGRCVCSLWSQSSRGSKVCRSEKLRILSSIFDKNVSYIMSLTFELIRKKSIFKTIETSFKYICLRKLIKFSTFYIFFDLLKMIKNKKNFLLYNCKLNKLKYWFSFSGFRFCCFTVKSVYLIKKFFDFLYRRNFICKIFKENIKFSLFKNENKFMTFFKFFNLEIVQTKKARTEFVSASIVDIKKIMNDEFKRKVKAPRFSKYFKNDAIQ